MSTGDHLRAARLALGRTLYDVAMEVGVSVNFIHKVEVGQVFLPLSRVEAFAAAYGAGSAELTRRVLQAWVDDASLNFRVKVEATPP